MERSERLSKLYKRFLSKRYGKKPPTDSYSIYLWCRALGKWNLLFRRKSDNKYFPLKKNINNIAKDYYKRIATEAIKSPGVTEIIYLGYLQVIDISKITGEPRMIRDEDDQVKIVVDDHFKSYPKYKAIFSIKSTKIRGELRYYLTADTYPDLDKRIVKQAYKAYPNGKFYRQQN